MTIITENNIPNAFFLIARKWRVTYLYSIKRIHFLKEIQMRRLQNVKGGQDLKEKNTHFFLVLKIKYIHMKKILTFSCLKLHNIFNSLNTRFEETKD